MDDVQNRFARELADAVAAAVAQSADVERCRERARAAGYHLHVTLDATVGFAALAGHELPETAAAEAPVEELPVESEEVPLDEVQPLTLEELESIRQEAWNEGFATGEKDGFHAGQTHTTQRAARAENPRSRRQQAPF